MALRSPGSLFRSAVHVVTYCGWLVGQIVRESLIMAKDTFTTGRNIAPVIIYYPLRVTKETDVAAFIASITMTPGTLALGITGPKEVDDDAASGKFNPRDIGATGPKEFRTHGLPRVQRFLAVHAMYGADPQELIHSLAVMEAKLAPEVKRRTPEFDVEHLVERGVPGPRGYRGTHGGRASEDSVFAVEKVDSTPHATAFVAAIMRAEDELDVADLPDLSKAEREKIAREHAEKMAAKRKLEQKRRREARAALAALGEEDASIYERAAEGLGLTSGLTRSRDGAPTSDAAPGSGATGSSTGDGREGGPDRSETGDGAYSGTGKGSGRTARKRRSGVPANSSLINALEVRARLPLPRLNIGRRPAAPAPPPEKDSGGDRPGTANGDGDGTANGDAGTGTDTGIRNGKDRKKEEDQ
ncbi:Na+/H+ antiporter subunit E [Corynebacterium neomassiliense]|uniref:Na+/H+ antiporter subunit E n=1 Tax=Corynebacterium neomassiliense TaxID=2079482 RepID=UPI0010311E9C|nr:Na+/H+ antiporter subunit E [Corynebacterium neomassiliense]